MKRKSEHPMFLVAFGVVLFAVTMNLRTAWQVVVSALGIVAPILVGLALAFVLNVPMTGFEHLLSRLAGKRKLPEGFLHGASLLLTLASIILVFVLAFTMLIPTLVDSARSIAPLFREKWPQWLALLNSYGIDTSLVTEWLSQWDVSKTDLSGLGGLFSSVASGVKTTISTAVNAVFGFVIAVYVLLSKGRLGPQVQKLLHAYLPRETADRLCAVAQLSRETYTKFLTGQCVEAVILGVLIFAAFGVAGLPYAALIGFLTGICAFIPYVGALAAFLIGTVLVLLAEPEKLLVCVIVYPAVQFVENQFIYPHVVGGSVGLAPLWTLIAALIGGKLFGLLGIIFFIPLAAVAYTLLREDVHRRLQS